MTAKKRNPQKSSLGAQQRKDHLNSLSITGNRPAVKSCSACLHFLPIDGTTTPLRGQCLRTSERLNAPGITGCDLWRPATGGGNAA